MNELAKNLQRWMELRDLSQNRLAEKAKVSQPTIFRILKNPDYSPGERTLRKIQAALDVDANWHDRRSNATESRLYASEWESEDDLDSNEFSLAPMMDIDSSSGQGRIVLFESEKYKLPFRRYTLHKVNVQPSDVVCYRIAGDSMEDRILDGSVVAMDTSDTKPRDGKIYGFMDGEVFRTKYLIRHDGEGMIIRSHNENYPVEILDADQVRDRLKIMGRVFWHSSLC